MTKATAILKIQGMNNSGRAQQLRRAANRLNGVLRVDINYILDTATIKYDADRLTLAEVKSLHHVEPLLVPAGKVVAEPRGGPTHANKYVQGRRGKGEINSYLRRRGRYGKTQRGRLGE